MTETKTETGREIEARTEVKRNGKDGENGEGRMEKKARKREKEGESKVEMEARKGRQGARRGVGLGWQCTLWARRPPASSLSETRSQLDLLCYL